MISVIHVRGLISKNNRLIVNSLKRFNSTSTGTTQIDPSNKQNATDSAKSTPVNDFYDIVICGGGMVGTAMAQALGQDSLFKNLKIALIESSPLKKYSLPPTHSNRVCALNDQTVQFLKSIDCFDVIEKNRCGSVHHMHVWDASSDASITFRNEDGSNLAIIVENDLIQESLNKNIQNMNNVKVFYSSQIKDFKQDFQTVEIKLGDNSSLTTKLLIGSDGANSFIRGKAKFNLTKWEYDQMAIVATLKLSEKTQNYTAWQRFLSTGPIALLPLNEEYSSLVWSIKKAYAKDLLEMSEEEFVNRINEAFVNEDTKNDFATNLENMVQNGMDFLRSSVPQLKDYIVDRDSVARILPPRIGECAKKTRAAYPLSFIHANNYVSNRIALIGDAVHRVHPLAGQGVNLGFGDIVCLVNCLRENVRTGTEIGSSIFLKKYETERQKEAYMKVLGIDFLYRLYTDANYPIRTPLIALRTLGLTISNRISPLKTIYREQAMK